MAATSPGQGMHPAAYFGPFSSCTQRWTVSFGLYTGKRKWLIRLPACGCHLIERRADRPKRTGSTASQEKGGDLSKQSNIAAQERFAEGVNTGDFCVLEEVVAELARFFGGRLP
jgi:hypothetical protein